MTPAQINTLARLCDRYHVDFHASDYIPRFDLPEGWVAGWVGGADIQPDHSTIYVGCSPEGEVAS